MNLFRSVSLDCVCFNGGIIVLCVSISSLFIMTFIDFGDGSDWEGCSQPFCFYRVGRCVGVDVQHNDIYAYSSTHCNTGV